MDGGGDFHFIRNYICENNDCTASPLWFNNYSLKKKTNTSCILFQTCTNAVSSKWFTSALVDVLSGLRHVHCVPSRVNLPYPVTRHDHQFTNRHLQGKSGVGERQLGYKKYLMPVTASAVSAKPRWGVGGGGSEYKQKWRSLWLWFLFPLVLCIAYCTCSKYLNIGREWDVRISPVKITVKRK